jgi:flagellar hook-associated protein 1 FlgK
MTNLLDIGRSGILAYRTALAVTAENVANVGTEGYRRRDVSTITAGGGQSTPITAPTGGQGVTVADIRRAFDALATERARGTGAEQAAAQSHLDGVRAIETLMIPGDDGIDGTLRQFFDALGALAGNPTDSVTRSQTLRRGEALAGAVAGLADGMTGLRRDLLAEASDTARTADALLGELADLSRRMSGLSDGNPAAAAALHPMADIRDTLLDRLSQLLPISVSLAQNGRPMVRLGHEAGPVLLEGDRAVSLRITGDDPFSLAMRSPDGALHETRLLPAGALGGLSRALGGLDMAQQELDSFARTLAQTMNAVHRGGIDLTGESGRDLFAMNGWTATPAPGNTGRVQIVIRPVGLSSDMGAVALIHDGVAGLWRAYDGSGAELASGHETLLLPGARIDLAGQPRDGDRIALTPVTGRAADLRWVLGDPAGLAAAGAFATAAAATNAGTARLEAAMLPPPVAATLTLNGDFARPPLDLLGGVIGVIPAGTSALDLVSLGRSASTRLMLPPAPNLLEITLDGVPHRFDLTGQADAVALSQALNDGALRSSTGRSLSWLGLNASHDDATGALILTRPGHAIPAAATLGGPGGTVTGQPTPAEPAGGTIQIITRNGQHLSGAPLSAAQAAALITTENGFLPGAVYDPGPLRAGAGTGYRGVTIGNTQGQAAHQALHPAPSMVAGPSLPLPSTPARSVVLADAHGQATVDLPQGASAALIADRLNLALPGIAARAETRLELSGFAAGEVRLSLTGLNTAPLPITAHLGAADARPLALAINALTAATGIRAETAPDGARLVLVQEAGHDITLSDLSTTAGAGLVARTAHDLRTLTQTNPAPAQIWTESGAIRQGGAVQLNAQRGFALTDGAVLTGSQPALDGGFDLTLRDAGAGAILRFDAIPALAEDGLTHRLHLNGLTVEAALPPGAPGAIVAATLAAGLRAAAPDAQLTGQALPSLPPDGSVLALRVDGGDYLLRMEAGAPVITGPEGGRVLATFDAQNRLTITARGITDGAGIAVAAAPGFGLGAGDAVLTLTGQAPDPAALPADIRLRVDAADHVLTMTATGTVLVPPGFPGTATRDPATGALTLTMPAPTAGLRIDAPVNSGMAAGGVALRLDGDRLILSGRDAPLDLRMQSLGALGQAVSLRDLPPEDLILMMTGSGTQRLSGGIAAAPVGMMPPRDPGALEVIVTDALRGLIRLRDTVTGDAVAHGVLDAQGRAVLGGLSLQIAGQVADGDRFAILPATAGSGNADTALALSALRNGDPVSGRIGLTERFATLQADTGLRVEGAARSLRTATATAEAAQRAQAAIGAVDLDTEAARLLELQQAYQANAQSMAVARDLFDTLLKLF